MTNNNMTASMWTVLDDSQAESLNGGTTFNYKFRISIKKSVFAAVIGSSDSFAIVDASTSGDRSYGGIIIS